MHCFMTIVYAFHIFKSLFLSLAVFRGEFGTAACASHLKRRMASSKIMKCVCRVTNKTPTVSCTTFINFSINFLFAAFLSFLIFLLLHEIIRVHHASALLHVMTIISHGVGIQISPEFMITHFSIVSRLISGFSRRSLALLPFHAQRRYLFTSLSPITKISCSNN